MLPLSQDILQIVRDYINETYTAFFSTNDHAFQANNVEIYPRSEGGYSVVLYKLDPDSVGGDYNKIFEYNTDPTTCKEYMKFCKGLEEYLKTAPEYDYFNFKVTPGKRLTKKVVNFTIYPEHKFDKKEPVDLEKFDIKELTCDSRLKQNESADLVSKFNKLYEDLNNNIDEDELVDEFWKATNPPEFYDPYDGINEFEQSFKTVYKSCNDENCDKNNCCNTDDYNNEMFESVLKECEGGAPASGGTSGGACDGCTTASDFGGQVPENMGAVVGPGKKDKIFSDVFGDKETK